MPVDDERLVRQTQEGDPEAFGALYEQYFGRIYRYAAFKLGDPPEAEDVTEQVFLRALESIGKYEHRGLPFSAWLFRIAANLVVDVVRRRQRRPAVPLDDTIVSWFPDPAVTVELALDVEAVAVAYRQLTDLQQQVIGFRFVAGLSVAETAAALGRTEGAIKAAQHGALASLQRRLQPGGLRSAPRS
ncbi:MAG: sigma-70 family RNA polymerase sigma factor [Chloroflexi bacterium]|nr:sigma-70 family RNA polymerase sigma factor [Chloroflexota bacterium]